jgi:hypothetical protein
MSLDATLGALVAESSTGVTAPSERRLRATLSFLVGAALVVAAGLGFGWAIGRATRSDAGGRQGSTVSAAPVAAAPALGAGARWPVGADGVEAELADATAFAILVDGQS